MLKLQFDDEILGLATRYNDPGDDLVDGIGKKLANWAILPEVIFFKFQSGYHRGIKGVSKKSHSSVEEKTKEALLATDAKMPIEILTKLTGVGFTTASAILHLTLGDRYPIIDSPALKSLGKEGKNGKSIKISFGLWLEYVEYCRKLAGRKKIKLRILDRALWQHTKENSK